MKNFLDAGVSQHLVETINKAGFTKPTPIQKQAIPVILDGKDILASAPTGTGKTGAFAIPLINKMLENDQESVLVLSPTRELATQIMATFRQFLGHTKSIPSALLIGGAPMFPQLAQVKRNPRLIVGTPGRINDHLERGTLRLGKVNHLVLDETDRMLDMGFDVQIKKIINKLPKDRQTLMFSATIPNSIMKLANSYLEDPVRISVGQASAPSVNVTQSAVITTEKEKHRLLVDKIAEIEGSVIVFVKTKRGAEELATKLTAGDLKSKAIHGDLRQKKREQIIRAFRNQMFRVMIATDVAARGIDIPHIQQVINYDLPQCPEDYIHRIGRTGRAETTGAALSFISPRDNGKWREIRRLIDADSAKNMPEVGPSEAGDTRPRNRRNNSRFKGGATDGFKSRRSSASDERRAGGFKSRKSSTSDDRSTGGFFKGRKSSTSDDRSNSGSKDRRNSTSGGRSTGRLSKGRKSLTARPKRNTVHKPKAARY